MDDVEPGDMDKNVSTTNHQAQLQRGERLSRGVDVYTIYA